MSNLKHVEVIQVIKSSICEGEGEVGDPLRVVDYYHTLKGEFLAKYDHWKETQK